MNILEHFDRVTKRNFAVIDREWRAHRFSIAVRNKTDPSEGFPFFQDWVEVDFKPSFMYGANIVFDIDRDEILKNRHDVPKVLIRKMVTEAHDLGLLVPKERRY